MGHQDGRFSPLHTGSGGAKFDLIRVRSLSFIRALCLALFDLLFSSFSPSGTPSVIGCVTILWRPQSAICGYPTESSDYVRGPAGAKNRLVNNRSKIERVKVKFGSSAPCAINPILLPCLLD